MHSAAHSAILAAARAALSAVVRGRSADAPPLRVAAALSGGCDSMALLDALATLVPEAGIRLTAVHVHHGLSPNADAWAAHCAAACTARGVPLSTLRVQVERAGGESPEAAARKARYAAFATVDADLIALAHHGTDQAETLLLQLLRGAGPHGLAAMPPVRVMPSGPALLRPFLQLPRATIEAYACSRALEFVDDESNANVGVKRNFLRHEIAPRLAGAFPGYPATLIRAAAHQADAAQLMDELAAIDAESALDDCGTTAPMLKREALAALAAAHPHRARNLLRWFLQRHARLAPSAARLAAMLDQLVHAAPDASVRLVHGGIELGVHRSRIVVHGPPVPRFASRWRGERELRLPHGTLEFAEGEGAGLDAARLEGSEVTVRQRQGSERMRLAHNRRSNTLTHLLQDADVPPWDRDALPFVWCGALLAAVPGIGIDASCQAADGARSYQLRWLPRGLQSPGAGSASRPSKC